MTNEVDHRSRALVTLGLVLAAFCAALFFSSTPAAQASESPYCGNRTLAAWNYCGGEPRTVYALAGWGDQHSVCVFFAATPDPGGFNQVCSGGPGQGAFSPLSAPIYAYPRISNNSGGVNTVRGIAYKP